MQAAKITRKRGELVLTAELSVMVSPPVFCCHLFCCLEVWSEAKCPRWCAGVSRNQAALVK
jgi:hypothetical protein